MMKFYRVKDEFVYNWTNENVDELVVTEKEIEDLAKGWAVPVEELMEQVEYGGYENRITPSVVERYLDCYEEGLTVEEYVEFFHDSIKASEWMELSDEEILHTLSDDELAELARAIIEKMEPKKRYEISIESLSFLFSGGGRTENEITEMYYKEVSHDPDVVGTYDTKEEAYKAWEDEYKDYAETTVERGNGHLRYLLCKVAILDEIVLDEDGDVAEINSMEMAVQPYHDLEDVLDEMRKSNGSFVDDYNDEYILLQQAYIDGTEDEPYFTALAINDNGGTNAYGLYPVYEVTWKPLQEWLDGDRDDEGDACDWDEPDDIKETGAGWDPEDGQIV